MRRLSTSVDDAVEGQYGLREPLYCTTVIVADCCAQEARPSAKPPSAPLAAASPSFLIVDVRTLIGGSNDVVVSFPAGVSACLL